jgi:oligoribonuclease NrnB/cAMP/cGMP phosphodiesterase (DHH superfamily)
MTTRPLIIYHGNCADGFAAAWCFWRKFKDGADYVAGVYQKPPPDVTGRDVYLVDFSYKRPVVELMLTVAQSVTLIDHHKTALDDLSPLFEENAIFKTSGKLAHYTDLDQSGAMLAWKYLNANEEPPLLLNHIQDRDLWRFKLPNTREIQANLFSYKYDFELWDKLMYADQAELLKMTVAGAAIERKHHKDIAELVSLCKRRIMIAGMDVPIASLPYTLSSDAGHLMAEGELFAACYWDTPETRIFSLRSTEDGIDVSGIASIYGGGGHKHAAGFSVPRNHPLATA